MSERFDEIVRSAIRECNENKEEILRAFVAKYGWEPNKYISIEHGYDSDSKCFKTIIARLDDFEMKQQETIDALLEEKRMLLDDLSKFAENKYD